MMLSKIQYLFAALGLGRCLLSFLKIIEELIEYTSNSSDYRERPIFCGMDGPCDWYNFSSLPVSRLWLLLWACTSNEPNKRTYRSTGKWCCPKCKYQEKGDLTLEWNVDSAYRCVGWCRLWRDDGEQSTAPGLGI